VLAGIVLLVPMFVSLGAAAGPAAAHAKVNGSAPADGVTVEVAPDVVTLYLDNKPATIEGDPLQVYGPDGERIDAADAHVGADGTELTVSMAAGRPRPAGEYHLLYRVVSTDSHLIAGHLTFHAARDAAPVAEAQFARGAGPAPARWHHSGAADMRVCVTVLAASGLLAAAAMHGTKGRRRRGRAF
jgi:methionine-rich copper-binding protein CopC